MAETKQTVPAEGNATGLRIGAILLWLAAIGLEVLAILTVKGVVPVEGAMFWVLFIGALVLDLVCVIIGSMLWKKSNRIDPASEKNKVKFWLWNNMGVIAAVIAFAPFIVLLLTDKNADGKTKKIGTIVAVVALLIAGLASYDFDPVSSEQLAAAQNAYGDRTVIWSANSKVYHSREDCQHVKKIKEPITGKVSDAFEKGKTRVCKVCAKKDADEGIDLTGVPIQDDANIAAELEEQDINSTEDFDPAANAA